MGLAGSSAVLVVCVWILEALGDDGVVDVLAGAVPVLWFATWVCVGVELTRRQGRVRALGVTMLVLAALALVALLLVYWYASSICDSCD